jgi:hypothetical protein
MSALTASMHEAQRGHMTVTVERPLMGGSCRIRVPERCERRNAPGPQIACAHVGYHGGPASF